MSAKAGYFAIYAKARSIDTLQSIHRILSFFRKLTTFSGMVFFSSYF